MRSEKFGMFPLGRHPEAPHFHQRRKGSPARRTASETNCITAKREAVNV
jgi:hypothetical protein